MVPGNTFVEDNNLVGGMSAYLHALLRDSEVHVVRAFYGFYYYFFLVLSVGIFIFLDSIFFLVPKLGFAA